MSAESLARPAWLDALVRKVATCIRPNTEPGTYDFKESLQYHPARHGLHERYLLSWDLELPAGSGLTIDVRAVKHVLPRIVELWSFAADGVHEIRVVATVNEGTTFAVNVLARIGVLDKTPCDQLRRAKLDARSVIELQEGPTPNTLRAVPLDEIQRASAGRAGDDEMCGAQD